MDTPDLFTWKTEYELGIPIIDSQHRSLLATAATLHEVLLTSDPSHSEIERLIQSIVDQKAEHFATEERLFAECAYEGAEEHAALHRGFSTHVDVLRAEHGHDLPLFAGELIDFLAHWFVGHLHSVDAKYVPCFSDHDVA